MSSISDSRLDERRRLSMGPAPGSSADALLQISLPPGTPRETEVAMRRLVDVTTILAHRASQLQHALDSRVVIEQAKGILAERYDLEMRTAFDVLRRAARSNRIRIHDLARRVVEEPVTPREIRAHRPS